VIFATVAIDCLLIVASGTVKMSLSAIITPMLLMDIIRLAIAQISHTCKTVGKSSCLTTDRNCCTACLVDFLLVIMELFSLDVTAVVLRAKIDRKSAISLQCGQFDPKFQVEGDVPVQ